MTENQEIEKWESKAKNNQYCQYDRLPALLKRYSFDEKIRICYEYSSKILQKGNLRNPESLQGLPLPFTLETFLMLSVEATEYQNRTFSDKKEHRHFFDMINAIWHHTPHKLVNLKSQDFIDWYLSLAPLTQFFYQQNYWILYYRYHYFFTFKSEQIDVPAHFYNCFGTYYDEFLQCGVLLYYLIFSGKPLPQDEIQNLLTSKFNTVTAKLSISRTEYVKLQRQALENQTVDEYIFSLRPSYTYAFIKHANRYFFPLPHLLPRNITSSLYYRLTEGNDTLRSLLGKNVIEQYVFEIVQQTHCYTDVRREIAYLGPRRTHAQSPDIIARHGNSILLLECKSTVPGIGMRTISDKTYCKTKKQLAKQIVQLYKSIQHFAQYNPYDDLKVTKDDIWGCVILLEDPYIRRENIYPQAFDSLDILESSEETTWIMHHIKIIDLYQLEVLCFCSNSIIDAIKKTNSTGEITAIPLEVPGELQLANPAFLQFRASVIEQIKKAIA